MKKFGITVGLFVFAVLSHSLFAQSLSGSISTPNGDPVSNVEVSLYDSNGTLIGSQTAMNGNYSFNGLTLGNAYELAFTKDNDPLNGVSTFDAVITARHILGITPFDTPEKIIAADVNLTNSVTTLDILLIRRVILNIEQEFPVLPSWRFIESTTAPGTNNRFSLTLNMSNEIFDVTGIKLGDINGSVVP